MKWNIKVIVVFSSSLSKLFWVLFQFLKKCLLSILKALCCTGICHIETISNSKCQITTRCKYINLQHEPYCLYRVIYDDRPLLSVIICYMDTWWIEIRMKLFVKSSQMMKLIILSWFWRRNHFWVAPKSANTCGAMFLWKIYWVKSDREVYELSIRT